MRPYLALNALQATLTRADQRLHGHDSKNLAHLLQVAAGFALIGCLLGFTSGSYHGGFLTIHHLSQSLLPDRAWIWITWFGDGRILLATSLLFIRRRPEIFWSMLFGAIIAALYSYGMKHYFNELRPPAVLSGDEIRVIGAALKHYSFPSGHTLTAFFYTGVLYAYSQRWQTKLLLILAASLVGISRVALGVHWPLDTIVGAFSGLLIAAFAVLITRYWRAGLRPTIHIGLLLIPVIATVNLLFDSQGNPWEPWLIIPLVIIALTTLVWNYRDIVTLKKPASPQEF